MADQIKVTNLPNPGSPAAVALEIWRSLRQSHGPKDTIADELAVYAECLNAANGYSVDESKLT